jgi:16S rRNA (cytosine967-C5)-methyltransferase
VARNRRADHEQVTPGTARFIASVVLSRVTEDGAFASRALDAELRRARLDPRDAALATEIVYGSLRVLPALDRAIEAHLTRAGRRMDGFVRATLRSAAYQLAHLGRLPTHAIVDESVSEVRRARGPKLAGFVNAMLRKLAASRPEAPEPPRALIVPAWVEACLADSLGSERMRRFLAEAAQTPALCLRAEALPRAQLIQQLMAAAPDAQIEPTPLSELGVAVRRAGSPRALAGYEAGAFSVQEEGAQLIALALGAQPGERIADVCAGHGGKTTLLARLVGANGRVSALDQDERKLNAIPKELARIGLDPRAVELHAVDLSVGTGGLGAELDRVLVDAPCTGLGTIHRRPELLLRLTPEDPARLGLLQRAILARAAGLVRPGGVLGYAVCSPTHAEGREVVADFQREHPGFSPLRQSACSSLGESDVDGVWRIGPWLIASGATTAPDAYQLALWRRMK